MDAFVIRTPKNSDNRLKTPHGSSTASSTDSSIDRSKLNVSKSSIVVSKSSSTLGQQNICTSPYDVGALNKIKPSQGQRRISDLGGVVVIEKIKEYVRKLSDPKIALVAKVIFLF